VALVGALAAEPVGGVGFGDLSLRVTIVGAVVGATAVGETVVVRAFGGASLTSIRIARVAGGGVGRRALGPEDGDLGRL